MRFRPLLTLAAVSTLVTFAAAPAAQADWLGLPGLGSGTADWVREYATDSTKVTMYAATEDDGVFRSTNNGVNWTEFNTGLTGIGGAKNVRTVFTSGTTVYAGTTAGLFKSVGGGGFQPVAQGPEVDPKNPKKLNQAVQAVFTGILPGSPMLAAVASGGVYKSTDGGETWQKPAPGNGMVSSETVWSLGSFKDNGALVYAASQSGIYISTDFGSTWTLSNDGITGQTMRAWADDKYPNIYYAGTTDGLFRSVTAGLTWNRISEDTTVRAITQFNGVDKKRIYAATDNGVVAIQTDLDPLPGKATWRKLTPDGMAPHTEVWGLNSFINTPGTLLAGTHGGGGKFLVLMPPVWTGPAKPTISDTTPQKSQKLTVTGNGTWTGTPTIEFTYQWQDCTAACVDVKDATDSSFVVPAQNRKYRVVVTAQNDFPTGPLIPTEKESDPTSASTAEPNSLPGDVGGTNTGSIKLTPAGQPQPGVTLTAQGYAFNNPAATSTTFQWYRCVSAGNCEKLQGATSMTYVLTDQEVGKHVCVAVTGHNASGSKTLDCTGITNEVLAPNPQQTSPVTLGGNAWVGHTLLSGVGTWAYSGMRYERRWMRCGADGGSCEYTGDKTSTYVIKAADLGKRLKVEIAADTNIANKLPNPAYVYTPLSDVVAAAPVEPDPIVNGGGDNDGGGGQNGGGGGGGAQNGGGGGGGVQQNGGGGQTPPPPGDKLAPVLSAKAVSASIKTGKALSLKVTLSEAVSLVVEYRKGSKKVTSFKVKVAAGARKVTLPKKKLAKGSYKAIITPVDAAGNKGAAKTVTFKVKR